MRQERASGMQRKECEPHGPVFEHTVDEEGKRVWLSGSREDMIEFVTRLLNYFQAGKPEYEERMEQHIADETERFDAALERREKAKKEGRSYYGDDAVQVTPHPFRVYVYPEAFTRDARSLPEEDRQRLGIREGSGKWVGQLLWNGHSFDEEEALDEWRQVKEQFERVSREMREARSAE